MAVSDISQKIGSMKLISQANAHGTKGKKRLIENITRVKIRNNIVV
jgi:hypothetical protein